MALGREYAKQELGDKLITNVHAEVVHSALATSAAAVQLAGALQEHRKHKCQRQTHFSIWLRGGPSAPARTWPWNAELWVMSMSKLQARTYALCESETPSSAAKDSDQALPPYRTMPSCPVAGNRLTFARVASRSGGAVAPQPDGLPGPVHGQHLRPDGRDAVAAGAGLGLQRHGPVLRHALVQASTFLKLTTGCRGGCGARSSIPVRMQSQAASRGTPGSSLLAFLVNAQGRTLSSRRLHPEVPAKIRTVF